MPSLKDLVGQRHGQLVVLERVENYDGACDSRSQYLCQCSCGATVVKVARNIVRGSMKQSCFGCSYKAKHPEEKKPHRNSPVDYGLTKLPRNINGFPIRPKKRATG
jgi:hypothetical protein